MPPTPKRKKRKQNVKMEIQKQCQNEHLQKYVTLEDFRQNGYQIRIQRKKLRISALVKIDFGHFVKKCQMSRLITLKTH